MTKAEINILIRTRAKEARAILQAVAGDLNKLAAAAANAGRVMDALGEAAAGYRASLGGTSAAAADLAKSLALINKSAGAAAKNINAVGVAAGNATPKVVGLTAAVDGLTTSFMRQEAASRAAASGLAEYTAAAKAATAAAAAGAGRSNANTAASAAGSAVATRAGAQAARSAAADWTSYAGATQKAIGGNRALASSWYDMGGTVYATSERLDQATGSLDNATRAIGWSGEAAQNAGQGFRIAGNDVEDLDNRVKRTPINWSAMNDKIYESSDALRKAGSQMQWTGRQLSVMFTAPTLLATGLGVKWAMDQEKAFTHMAKVYDGAITDIDTNLQQAGVQFSGSPFDKFFTALSEKMGQTKEEVANIGGIWAQVGAQGRNLAEATKLTTEFMVVGDQDAAKSANDLIAIQAQYKLSIQQLQGVVMDLNAIENATAVSMRDLADGFTRTAAVAREAGVDTRQLGAFLAALVPAAGTAAVSANGLKSIFTRLLVPTDEASAQLRNLGINVSDPNWISKNAVDRLKILGERMQGLSQQQKFDLAKPFAGLYQINKFLALMDDLASSQGYYAKALAATESPQKSFATYQQELNRVLESSPQKLKQVGVILQNSLVKIITPLLPHIIYLAQGLAKLVKSFSELNPTTQKWIVLGALMLAAVGPLAMLIGSFAILFGAAGKSMAIFNRVTAWTAFNLLGLGKATRAVGDEVVTRTPLIVKAWRGMMTAMSVATTAGVALINGIWTAGMAALNLVMSAGSAVGLGRFAWFEAMRARVQQMAARKLIATEAATQAALNAEVAVGGATRAAESEAAGAAAAAGAARGGKRGLLGFAAMIVTFFPQAIWTGIKAIPGLFARLWPAILTGLKEFGPKFLGVFARLGPRLGAIALDLAGFLTGPVGWAITGLITLISFFPSQTWAIMKRVGSLIARPFIAGANLARQGIEALNQLVARGMQWITAQIADMAAKGVPLLAQPFVLGVRMASAALKALPDIVVSVFKSVVSVITSAAKAVYNAFSYINPFAHHSPSLVENVTAGMAIVKDEFSSMADSVTADSMRAYESIRKFGEGAAGLTARANEIELNKKRDSIAKADPNGTALPAYDQLRATLPPLQAEMDQLNDKIKQQQDYIESLNGGIKDLQNQIKSADKAIDQMNKTLDAMRAVSDMLSDSLDKAKSQLDYYSNAPIKGMRAMSDAIFANQMAQKKLQLEIMKMEDAGQTIDDVKDKYAALQGQIEELSGKREELRMAGAGSDILGTYDQMIKDLQGQQGDLAQADVSKIDQAQKALEKLQREGEKLDLENSLKFDPLTRQIDQLINSTQELSFDEITRGIQTNQAAVAGLTAAYDASNAAIKIQEGVIKGAEAARDALNDKLDTEQDHLDAEQQKLDTLQKAHDTLSDAIDKTKQSMDDLVSSADTVNQYLEEQARLAEEAAKAAAKAGKLTKEQKKAMEDAAAFDNAALGDFAVPGGGQDFNLSDLMGGNQNFDDLTKQLTDDVANAFGKIDLTQPIKDFFGRIGDKIKAIPGDIGNWFAGIAEGIGNWFAQLPGKVGGWFSGLGSAIGGWFSSMWSEHIWPALQALPGQIGQFFMDLPNNLIDALSYMAGFLFGLLIKAIVGAFKLGGELLKLFGEAFMWVVTNGAELLKDIIVWFAELPPKLIEAAGDIGAKLWEWIKAGFWWIVNNGPDLVKDLILWFADLPNKILGALGDLGSKLVEGFKSAIDWLINEFPGWAGNIISGLWNGIIGALGDVASWVKEHIVDPFVNGFKDALGIHSPSTVFADFGKNIVEGLWNGIISIKDWLVQKVKDFAKEAVVDPVKDFLGIHSPSKMFYGFGVNVAEGMANGISAGSSTAASAATAMAQALAGAASAVDVPTDAVNPLLAPPAPDQLAALSTGLSTVGSIYDTAYTGISANTQAITGGMYTGLGAANLAYTTNTQLAYATMASGVTTTAATMSTALLATTASTATQMTNAWNTGTQAVTDATVQMADNGTNEFQRLADNISGIMTNDVAPMMQSFDPMLQQVAGWFSDTVTNIGTIWSGVKEPVAVPSRFIVNDVYNKGIKVAWNNVSGWLGLKELPDAVAAFQTGGAVDRKSLINPATPRDVRNGGKLLGTGSGDKTLFAGQGGEFVWSRAMVKAVGGVGPLEAFRRRVMSGGSAEGAGAIMGMVPGFATGGQLPGKVIEAQDWARRTFTGQQYVYGGVGPNGFDCSGAVGAMWAYLTNKANPFQRWFDTESIGPAFGFAPGLNGAFTVGVHHGGGGPLSHTAATLGGINLEAGGAHNSSIFGGPAAGADNPQFEAKWTLPEIGGVFASGGMGGGSAPSMLQRVTEEFKRVMDPIRDTWPQTLGDISKLDPTGYQKNYDEVSKFLYGKASEYDAAHPAMGNTPYNGAGVEQWRGLVQKILQAKGYPVSLDETVLRRMNQESGGNPNAINLWDENAKAGHPSKGLMQVIDTTFAAYQDAGYGNIWAPEDNIRASMNYARARYGSLEAAYNQAGGYDRGGILPPTPGGFGTFYNLTGKPEAVLTNAQWNAVMDQSTAIAKFSSDTVADGTHEALVTVLGDRPTKEYAEATATAMKDANAEWTPNLYEASDAQVAASNAVTATTKKTTTALDKFTTVGKQISTSIQQLSTLMLALSQAAQNPNDFNSWVPVINAAADFISSLPDAEATYVPWAGTNQTVTEEMKRQKALNDAANAAKGLYNVGKAVLPVLLKHTAIIGSAIAQLIAQNGPIVAAAIAMFPVNPIGAAIMLIPVILQSIFTLLPLIINAILDIVPTLIKAIMKFLASFMPDSVYAYDTYDAAAQAAADNQAAIKAGASAPYYVRPDVQQSQSNSTVTINVYGVNVNADSADSADQFVTNLQNLS